MKQRLFSKWSFIVPTSAFLLMGFAWQGALQLSLPIDEKISSGG